jgi:hypothetical protein
LGLSVAFTMKRAEDAARIKQQQADPKAMANAAAQTRTRVQST